jgi:hypothetical protein
MVDANGKAGIWAVDAQRAVLAWSGRAASVESKAPARTPLAAGPWHITAAGVTLVASGLGGCGCGGSPLRMVGEMTLAVLDVPA